MPTVLPSTDVVSAAQAYSAFGGVLVGFALTGLFWYLTKNREDEQKPAEQERRTRERRKPAVQVDTRHVTLTVFYAMASLAMTSFLYASLAGEAVPEQVGSVNTSPAWAVTALLPYGVAFGLSVLMLFYGLTLVMLERGLHREAGWAYWVVACAGPAVVLRFLLTAAGAAQEAVSGHPPDGLLSRQAMFWWVLGAAAAAAIVMLVGLDWWWIRWLLKLLANRPALPAVVVFVLVSVMTGLVSLYFDGRPFGYRPQPWIVSAGLWAAVTAVAVFALACGCVIGSRVQVSVPPRISAWRIQRKKERAAFVAGAVLARGGGKFFGPGDQDVVFMVYLPNAEERWRSASPPLRALFDLLSQYGGEKLRDLLTVTAEWEEIDRGWPRLVKLHLHFAGLVTGSASVVVNLAKVPNQGWHCVEDGGEVTITTKKRLRKASLWQLSPWAEECVRLGPARHLKSGN